jgi:hypothetical protein
MKDRALSPRSLIGIEGRDVLIESRGYILAKAAAGNRRIVFSDARHF